MKRFVFTLRAVYDVAVSTEKQQKTHLKRLTERLEQLRGDLRKAEDSLLNSRKECNDRMRKGIDSDKLAWYSLYFESMINTMSVLIEQISKAQEERDKWIAEYIKTRNKIKALDKIRDDQLEEYNKELRKEEENEIGDILSFKVAAR